MDELKIIIPIVIIFVIAIFIIIRMLARKKNVCEITNEIDDYLKKSRDILPILKLLDEKIAIFEEINNRNPTVMFVSMHIYEKIISYYKEIGIYDGRDIYSGFKLLAKSELKEGCVIVF